MGCVIESPSSAEEVDGISVAEEPADMVGSKDVIPEAEPYAGPVGRTPGTEVVNEDNDSDSGKLDMAVVEADTTYDEDRPPVPDPVPVPVVGTWPVSEDDEPP